MIFSFIIINYRTTEITAQCLRSIFNFCPGKDWEIILIDNASNDGGAEKLEKDFGNRLTLVKNDKNLGFAAANNQGAKIARGQYLFFLNSDTILTAAILAPLQKILEEHQEIGVLSPQLLNQDLTRQNKSFGSFPALSRLIGKNRRTEKEPPLIYGLNFFDWVSGAALIIRKNIFLTIDGWDKNFFLYLEDTDLCWRVQKLGYRVAVSATTSLIHLGGQSLKAEQKKRSHYFDSQDYFFQKHYGWLTALALKIIRWPYKTWVLYRKL